MGERPNWIPSRYLIAMSHGVRPRDGVTFGGLGMHKEFSGSPKGKRPPRWALTHLGSGHAICFITAHTEKAFEIASEITQMGDWEFLGLHGWKNLDPSLRGKVAAAYAKYPKELSRSGSCNNEPMARSVAEARA